MSIFTVARSNLPSPIVRRSDFVLRGLLLFALALGPAVLAHAKTLRLDHRWKIEASEDWWYFQTEDNSALRTYTFGLETPEVSNHSLGIFLVTKQLQGVAPRIIRDFSIGLAREPLGILQLEDAKPYVRQSKGPLLHDGVRADFEVSGHKFTTASFVFDANLLPGKPIENAKDRRVMVVVGGTSDDEIEQFIRIFEKIEAVAPPPEPNAAANQ